MELYPLNSILVVDEAPLIAVGLQEVFRSIHPSITVEHIENIYTALSAPRLNGSVFDLVILGSWPEETARHLFPSIAGVKGRFGNSRVMVYTTIYDHRLIEKMELLGVDAYIHKSEPIQEVIKAYGRMEAGERYISNMFHTLFYDFQFDNSSNSS